MKRIIFLSVVLTFAVSCTKENVPYEDLTTSFEGIVYTAPNEALQGGSIMVIGGYGKDAFNEYIKEFPVESDGTFSIRITTDRISEFQLFLPEGQSCSGSSISDDCNRLQAGKDHKDIVIYAYN